MTTPGSHSSPHEYPKSERKPDRRAEFCIANGRVFFRSGYDHIVVEDGNVFKVTAPWEPLPGDYDLNITQKLVRNGPVISSPIADFSLEGNLRLIDPEEGPKYYGTNYAEYS